MAGAAHRLVAGGPLLLTAERARRLHQDAVDEQCVRSFSRFVRESYSELNTGTELVWDFFHDAICDHLEAVIRGDITRLIINIRNRSLKSTIASIDLHPWAWLQSSWMRFFTGGHDGGLAVEHCWASRQLIRSAFYQRLLERAGGTWALEGDQNVKSFYANTDGGRRLAAQTGAGTGKGGHCFIIDDPLSIDGSYSEAINATANRWVTKTVMSRFDDPATSRLVVVQHRLRTDDTSGVLREMFGDQTNGGRFDVLELPLEYDPKRVMPATSLGWVDPRDDDGESLSKERWTPAIIEDDKKQFGDLYAAICNQRPEQRGTNILQPEWFPRTGPENPVPLFGEARKVLSVDCGLKGSDPTAMKKGQRRSKTAFVAGLVVGERGHASRVYIVDYVCRVMSPLEREDAFTKFCELHADAREKYIENEAGGPDLIARMSQIVSQVEAISPGGISKYQRLAAVAGYFRAHNVWFPPDDAAPWVRPFIENLYRFPNVEYDDDVDALSQLVRIEMVPEKPDGEMSVDKRLEFFKSITG